MDEPTKTKLTHEQHLIDCYLTAYLMDNDDEGEPSFRFFFGPNDFTPDEMLALDYAAALGEHARKTLTAPIDPYLLPGIVYKAMWGDKMKPEG